MPVGAGLTFSDRPSLLDGFTLANNVQKFPGQDASGEILMCIEVLVSNQLRFA
jgi:hypothetical protein